MLHFNDVPLNCDAVFVSISSDIHCRLEWDKVYGKWSPPLSDQIVCFTNPNLLWREDQNRE